MKVEREYFIRNLQELPAGSRVVDTSNPREYIFYNIYSGKYLIVTNPGRPDGFLLVRETYDCKCK